MTTVQQTGSIDLGVNNTAAKTATNYITADSTGIQVHNTGDTSDYVQITSDGMDVYNDGTNVARFGSDGTRIGKPYVEGATDNESHLELDYHSLQMIDKEGNAYLHVSDLRAEDGGIVAEFTGDGTTTAYILPVYPYSPSNATNTSLTIDGVTKTWGIGGDYVIEDNGVHGILLLMTPAAVGASLVLRYKPIESVNPKAFTFGTRNEIMRGLGAFSATLGSSCAAISDNTVALNKGTIAYIPNQTAIGKYNKIDDNGEYALIIGNGTADDARRNTLAVRWTGDDASNNTPGALAVFSKRINGSVTPSSNIYTRLLSGVAANNEVFGSVGMYRSSDSYNLMQFEAQNAKSDGTFIYNTLKIGVKDDGTRWVGVTDAAVWRKALGLKAFATKDDVNLGSAAVSASAKNSAAVSANSNFSVSVSASSAAGKAFIAPLRIEISGTGTGGAVLRGFDVNGMSVGGSNEIETHWRTTTAIAKGAATVSVQFMTMNNPLS